jgi:Tfp pilus assembly protein PilV
MRSSLQSGQTLIEVLVALSTAVVIVSAGTLTVITALRNAEQTQIQNTATRYSQEGMEFMRYLRDSNYTEFTDLIEGPTYCLDKNATSVYTAYKTSACGIASCEQNVDLYSRSIIFDRDSPYCAPLAPSLLVPTPVNTATKVTVIVSWTDSRCPNACPCHESKLVSCLSDYTIAPTPGDNNTPTPTP